MCMHSIALDKSLGQTEQYNVRKYLSIFQNDIFRPNMCSIDLPSPEITFECRPVISMEAASLRKAYRVSSTSDGISCAAEFYT